MALARADGDTVAVFTIAADGTDAQQVTTVDRWWPAAWTERFRQQIPAYARPDPAETWVEDVAWSPDGARILVRANPESGIVVASVDGQERTLVEAPLELAGESQPIQAFWAAAWSPDGARLALLGLHVDALERRQPMLLTMAPDGSDRRLLMRGVPQATGGGAPVGPVGAAACRAGIVVPDPERQPGLVADCEALLALRDALVLRDWRGNERELDWREDLDRPLRAWEGVTLSGTPERVTGLDLSQRSLHGAIPVVVGRLGKLESLRLRTNNLTGPIPTDLAQLLDLRELDLSDNRLTGPIPESLGQLAQLRSLSMSSNDLTGPIPSILGQLADLETLNLGDNDLSGPIPAELGQLRNLRWLSLHRNRLSGQIPAEIGELSRWSEVTLRGNQWTGCIPPELQQHVDLRDFGLPPCGRAE